MVVKTMKDMKKILLICLLATAFAACSKDSGTVGETGEKVDIRILPTVVSAEAGQATRARISGTAFPVNSQLGLAVKTSPSNVSINAIYDNVMSLYNGTTWGYYLDGVYSGTVLAGFKDWGAINLCGYYPYNASATNIAAVPFRIASGSPTATASEEQVTVDYMVAAPKTKDLLNNMPAGYLSLEFSHVMTAIDIRLRRAYVGPDITLVKAKFEIAAPRSFTVAGTINAMTPSMTDMGSNITANETVQVLEVAYNKVVTYRSDYLQSPLLILPELRQNGTLVNAEMKITLYFNDTNGNPFVFEDRDATNSDGNGNPVITFNLSAIDNTAGGSADKGFLAGSVYTVQASIGNYVKFAGVPKIVQETLDDAGNPEYIEI